MLSDFAEEELGNNKHVMLNTINIVKEGIPVQLHFT
jgi:hypothetical protein